MPTSDKDALQTPAEPTSPIPDNIVRAIQQRLISLKSAGVQQLPKPTGEYEFPGLTVETAKSSPAPVVDSPPDVVREPKSTVEPHTPPQSAPKYQVQSATNPISGEGAIYAPADSYGEITPVSEREAKLAVLQQEVAACTLCQELAASRKQTVFGVGTSNPRLVFFGEAPGADEDRLGEPFVGAAGQLLTKIIEAMKLKRSDVYILNTLKCRPPGNRNPKEIELRNCCDFSIRQLEILQPEFICCLGSIAAKTLLNTKQSIGRMRGQFYQWRGSRVLATYHPAYLLRSPEAKKHVWNDMKLLMAEMGL